MEKMKNKTNKLGNLALIFSFAAPVIGLILGIVAIIVGAKAEDRVLRNDGIKAVIFSIVVGIALALLTLTILMLAGIMPFVISTLGV